MAKLSRYLTKIRQNKVRLYIKGKILDIGCGEANAINYKAVTKYSVSYTHLTLPTILLV